MKWTKKRSGINLGFSGKIAGAALCFLQEKMMTTTGEMILIIWRTIIDPADDRILLCLRQCSILRHQAGSYLSAYCSACTKYFCVIGKWAGAIGASCIVTGSLVAKSLNKGIYICSKILRHSVTCIGSISTVTVFTAGNKDKTG